MSFYGDIHRWWIGTVEEASGQTDPTGLGRCKVRIDGIHGPDIRQWDLPYAQTILPATSGGTSGNVETPQLLSGAKVIGFFLDGALSQLPVIWGYIPFTEKPSIIQQDILAKEKRSITQTHNTKAFVTRSSLSPNPSLPSDNLKIAWDFFTGSTVRVGGVNGTDKKFKPHHIAGMLGNFMHESGNSTIKGGIDPNKFSGVIKQGKKEGSYGIAQWNPAKIAGNRLGKLQAFAKAEHGLESDLLIQLAFVVKELTDDLGHNKGFFDTTDTVQATMHFMRWYERPAFTTETTPYFRSPAGTFPKNSKDRKRPSEKLRLKAANAVLIYFTEGVTA